MVSLLTKRRNYDMVRFQKAHATSGGFFVTHMNMTNLSHVRTPFMRFALSAIAAVVLVTSTNVQAATAEEMVASPVIAPTEQVATAPGIEVPPVATPKAAPVKKWNTMNSADLVTQPDHSSEAAVRTLVVPTTAYTSEPGQTDSSPFTTADGSRVRDGIIAANFLKIGTRVRIPEYFGDKVFEVHDRMNARYTQRVDIWMTKKSDAYAWGVRRVTIEILP